MPSITSRIGGYYRRAKHEMEMRKVRKRHRRKEVEFRRWLEQLQQDPPDVLIGANFAAFGGVKHHIEAIARHSTLATELAPPPWLNRYVGPSDLTATFRPDFDAWQPGETRAIHSHVYPWFTNWCHTRSRDCKTKWIHTYHLMYYEDHGEAEQLLPWQTEINSSLINVARHADLKLSVSKWQVQELRARYDIEAHYLPNGVDAAFCSRADPRAFARKAGTDRFVLYVGRNDPVKNPVEFVRLAERMPDETFVMIGGGLSPESLGDDGRIEVPQNVLILGGMKRKDVQSAIAACSVLVVTSRREGLPTLVLEGMTHEVPIVVPNEAGCMEAIGNGAYGDIYQLGDIDDLERKVAHSLASGRTDRDARQRVLEEFDWPIVATQLDRIYAS